MDNIFKDAKFGYIYVTKNGHKNSFCAFTTSNGEHIARLYREGWGVVFFHLDGRVHSGIEFGSGIDFDIIGKLEEPIDEKELDKLAREECYVFLNGEEILDTTALAVGFKHGYRKAKESSHN